LAISVEEARELLRREVEAGSLNAVASRVGIDRSTLRTFIMPDGVQKPIGRVLEPILEYAERRLALASSAAPGEWSPPSRDQLIFWRGQLSVTLRWMGAIQKTVQQVYEEIGEATGPVRDLLASDVLPEIDPAIVRAAQTVANIPREPRPSADAGAASGQAAASGAPAPATQPARRRGRRAS
jgi:hypothetical protein